MKKYKIKSVPTKHGAFIRRRIDKSRFRAEVVGMTYLFTIIVLAALSCFALISSDFAAIGVQNAVASVIGTDFTTVRSNIQIATAGIYLLMLVVLFINILRAFTHLKNLFKKKVSRVYGLNANIDAMESLGNIFSVSFACILIHHLVIYALCGSQANLTAFAYVVLVLGFVVHFICGFCGGKVSVFYIDEESGVSESKRPYGRLIPLIRNLLQFAAIVVICYILLKYNTLHDTMLVFLTNGARAVRGGGRGLIPAALEVISIIWVMGLIMHAVNTSEYSVEGPYAPGIKNFRIFSLFLCGTSLLSVAWQYFIGEASFFMVDNSLSDITIVKSLDIYTLVMAGVSLVMFIFDYILKLRWTKEAILESEEENRPIIPNISVTTPKQPISIQVPELKVPELSVHMPAAQTQAPTPININMPAAQTQAPTPINVHMPAARAQAVAPINVNIPAAQTQAPAPINVAVPAANGQLPVNVMIPANAGNPVNVFMPNPAPVEAPAATPDPMLPPMVPPLMTMNPMMQPYPMHMNMPMVNPVIGMMPMVEEPAEEKQEPIKAEETPVVETPVVEAPVEVEPVVEPEKEEDVDVNILPIIDTSNDEEDEEDELEVIRASEWEISCPTCGKSLKTQTGSLYHRCPACDNVFELQKKTRKVSDNGEVLPDDETDETEESEVNEANE